MTNRKVKYSIMTAEDEEKINYLMPDIVLAVETLQMATADRILQCLEECDVRASPSQILMALEYGCRLGLMEERTRYRLSPELSNRANYLEKATQENKSKNLPPCCTTRSKKKPIEKEVAKEDDVLRDSFNESYTVKSEMSDDY